MSRREFLRLLAALSAAGVAGCGGVEGTAKRGEEVRRRAASVNHPETEIGDWTFSNWPLYMQKKIIREFDEEYGGTTKYVEEINDNQEFTGRVEQQLRTGKSIGRDIVVLSDTTVARWIRSGWVEPLDLDNIPNRSNLVPELQGLDFDPEGSFSLPYQSGAIGIGYDIKRTGGELTSIEDMFDPRFKGQVTFLSDAEDAGYTMLLAQGIDPAEATLEQKLAAIERVGEIADSGQFRRFTGNDYTTDLAKGNAWISLAYSGDVVQLQSDNPDLRFAYPEEGAMLFTDHFLMPAKAEHPYAAETMMNYLYEPEVAARVAAWVNYISPVEGIREILEDEDPQIAENPLIFPPDEVRERLHPYPDVSGEEERAMNEAMAQVTGA